MAKKKQRHYDDWENDYSQEKKKEEKRRRKERKDKIKEKRIGEETDA